MTLHVHHHTALQLRGGAVRVATLLQRGLANAGVDCSASFEFAETGDLKTATPPERLGPLVRETAPKDALVHVHGSGDWVRLLSSLDRAPVMTLHDCDLFTGGCAYPLNCAHFSEECKEPCPRDYPECAGYREAKKLLVDKLQPVLVSPSGWLAGLAREALPGHTVRVIPNGIPWPETPPDKAAARKAMGIHPAARVVVFVAHGGEKAAYKAGNRWRELWDDLCKRAPNMVGFAVGGDTAFTHNGLHFWPYVDRTRMARLLAAADVLLYPSLADNHPLVVLEAQAQGLPTVAFAAGGIPEQIRDGDTGLLVREQDFGALAETAATLLTRPRQAREMGVAAFYHGQKRFTTERMVNDYLRLYRAADQQDKNEEDARDA